MPYQYSPPQQQQRGKRNNSRRMRLKIDPTRRTVISTASTRLSMSPPSSSPQQPPRRRRRGGANAIVTGPRSRSRSSRPTSQQRRLGQAQAQTSVVRTALLVFSYAAAAAAAAAATSLTTTTATAFVPVPPPAAHHHRQHHHPPHAAFSSISSHSFPRPPAAATTAITTTSLPAYTDGTDRTAGPSSVRRVDLPPATSPSRANNNVNNSSSNGDNDKKKRMPAKKAPSSLPTVLPNGGRITLLGSGPGDPNLLTVSAYRLLTTPNPSNTLIIIDRLVSQEIIDLIPSEAHGGPQIKIANKHPGCQHAAQSEIYEWVGQGIRGGKHVIRLKIGDPFVFGRGGEEVLWFRRELGVESVVVPGVSAAFSAPLLGSIPVTHRGISNQVVMCTGYGKNNTSPDLIQYHPEQTVVFLMAVGRLRQLSDRLVSMAGYPETTPVGIVERAGCPDQRTVVGTIGTIADIATEHNVKSPSTIVVGEVVRVLLDGEDGEGEGGEAVVGLVQDCAAAAATAAG